MSSELLRALKMARDAFTGLSDDLPHVHAVRAAILKAEQMSIEHELSEWVLVPSVPTTEMKRAANKAVCVNTPDGTWALALDEAARAYETMLAAAPIADAAKAFSAWIGQGPKLAKAAGVHVGIKVTEAKS